MKKVKIFVLLFIGIIFTGVCVQAGETPVIAKVFVDRTKITVGDRINLRIVVTKSPKTELLQFNPFSSSEIFEVKDYKKLKTKKRFGRELQEFKYVITSYTVGSQAISPLRILYKDISGNTAVVLTDTISISVESVLKGETAAADIKDIKPPLSMRSYLFFYIFILVIIAVVYFYIRMKKKTKNGFFDPEEKTGSPYELALEMLKKLEAMELVEKGDIKQHYIILSEILRHYIEGRYAMPAIERTTNEIYQAMRAKEIERKHCILIKELLEQCDLIKFAKFVPEKKVSTQDMQRSYEIIETTKEIYNIETGTQDTEEV